MFITQEVVARRGARTGFGIVLVIGAIVMFTEDRSAAALTMVLTWLAAFTTYGLLSRCHVNPARCEPDTLLRASLVWPTLGVLLMLPLLVHLPIALLVGGVDSYGAWVTLSYPFTATTTCVAALLGTIRALELADGRTPRGVLTPAAIYGLSLGLGLIPYGVFILPPIVIALTGWPFIALFAYQEKLVERERTMPLAELPAAIARWRALTPKGA